MAEQLKLPKHVAIVMDGNGRWAKQRDLPRIEGHKAGVTAARKIVEYCGEVGIPYLTLYAFSSENWHRPKDEVMGLMKILYHYLTQDADVLIKNEVCLRVIGVVDKLPVYVQKAVQHLCHQTKDFSKLYLTIALSYGSRDEIIRACKKVSVDVAKGKICADDIDEAVFSKQLDTHGLPDPDLFIRTSGEMRLSNFLLWQLSYAELYFTDVFWPDFSEEHLAKALTEFQQRERRFGSVLD